MTSENAAWIREQMRLLGEAFWKKISEIEKEVKDGKA